MSHLPSVGFLSPLINRGTNVPASDRTAVVALVIAVAFVVILVIRLLLPTGTMKRALFGVIAALLVLLCIYLLYDAGIRTVGQENSHRIVELLVLGSVLLLKLGLVHAGEPPLRLTLVLSILLVFLYTIVGLLLADAVAVRHAQTGFPYVEFGAAGVLVFIGLLIGLVMRDASSRRM